MLPSFIQVLSLIERVSLFTTDYDVDIRGGFEELLHEF
jgi:hypothetical protein